MAMKCIEEQLQFTLSNCYYITKFRIKGSIQRMKQNLMGIQTNPTDLREKMKKGKLMKCNGKWSDLNVFCFWCTFCKLEVSIVKDEKFKIEKYKDKILEILVCPNIDGREGNGTPLHYSCLENPMDGGAWWATVPGVTNESDSTERLSVFTFMHWRRQPTPVFLPGEFQGWGSLVGCRLWGHTESDMTEVT